MSRYGSMENRVRAWKRLTRFVNGHWLFQGHCDSMGYGRVRLHYKNMQIHRVSAHVFLGLDLKDRKQQANHKKSCPYKCCWNPECLYVGTQADNMADRKRKHAKA